MRAELTLGDAAASPDASTGDEPDAAAADAGTGEDAALDGGVDDGGGDADPPDEEVNWFGNGDSGHRRELPPVAQAGS